MTRINQRIVSSICGEMQDVKRHILTKTIEAINASYTEEKKEKKKVNFRTLWGSALLEAGISDLFEQKIYVKAVAAYYKQRRAYDHAQKTKKMSVRARDMKVVEATTRKARIQVTPNAALVFVALKPKGTLESRNLDLQYTVTSGRAMPPLTRGTYRRARNKARIAINKIRKKLQH